MKGGSRTSGYTIIEVMIVLAVSSVMFLIAAAFVNGKQAKAAFTEGTNEFSADIQSVITQVTNGQYSDVGLNCSHNDLNNTTTVHLGGTNGHNPSCIFLGKVIYLKSSNTVKSAYDVYSLAGGRVDGSGLPPGTVITPQLVGPAAIDPLTLQQEIPQGLYVLSVKSSDGSTAYSSVGIAFTQGLGSIDSAGNVAGGAQSASLYIVNGLTPGLNTSNLTGADVILGTGANYVPVNSVTICLTDGARYVNLTLGGTASASNPLGDTLSVNIQVVNVCT